MARKADCDDCRATWAMYKEEPKCDECMAVELDPANVMAYAVYSQCSGQLITAGMDGSVIDISIPAVETVMQWMGVKKKHRGKIGLRVLSVARKEIREVRKEKAARAAER